MIKKINVSGVDYMMFATPSQAMGYRLSVVTTEGHPYRIIRDKIFPKGTTEKNIEEWAVDILSQIKN